ncbi:hypothetical protein BH787_gp32 [Gordonia phage GMA4]|uniref:hypothetical protein n=1 Tax=Gordonia phage GMA4 TaxID=1647471 RepID=UPI0006BD7401|nr:hypothetical protein BH787_gp32 [Gordonia phage GMA4]AKJ72316.1 hypothetical protein GMA4_41 [Gordonia phage GMA4]
MNPISFTSTEQENIVALLPPMSTASLKFPEVGTTHTGTLIEIGEPQQETEFRKDGQGPPAFWDKDTRTRPKMQIKLTLQCAVDASISGDDGRRALYATVNAKPGGLYAVINKALESANSLGGKLTVTFTGTDPDSQNPDNPRKLYAASYVEPSLGDQMNAAAQSAPAAAAPPPAAAPVETIPAPWTAEQWATFTPEQKQAILAQQPAASQ